VRITVRRRLALAGSVVLTAVLLIWSLLPVYNIFLIALDPEEGEIEFTGNIVPSEISFDAFGEVFRQEARYLDIFWLQFGNSLIVGIATMLLTLLIASFASFAVGRMRLTRNASLLVTAALATYAVPASFLVFPFHRVMHVYGLYDHLLGVVLALVTFAVPFAVLLLLQYGRLIPLELDDAARIDGASALQVYRRIYLPAMAPALAIVALFALLVAWNDYIYQFVLLVSQANSTVAMVHSQLFSDTDAEWNAMMAAAIIYVLPPFLLFIALRRHVMAGLRIAF
jgi:multiple sugar transport system permease protein